MSKKKKNGNKNELLIKAALVAALLDILSKLLHLINELIDLIK